MESVEFLFLKLCPASNVSTEIQLKSSLNETGYWNYNIDGLSLG